jgi:hypothetical protein
MVKHKAIASKLTTGDMTGNQRVVFLERLGYMFKAASPQAGEWRWIHPHPIVPPSAPFATKELAVESAWADAIGEGQSFAQLSDADWENLTPDERLPLIEEALTGG